MDEIDEVEAELVCGHREAIQAEALDLSVPLNPVDEDFSKLSWRQRFSSIWSFATQCVSASSSPDADLRKADAWDTF